MKTSDKRVRVDTSPLGARDTIVDAGPGCVWPWYAASTVLLAAALVVGLSDLTPSRASAPTSARVLARLVAVPARPALTVAEAPRDLTTDGGASAPRRLVAVAPEAEPETAKSLNSKGYAARKRGDHDAARRLYEAATRLDPNHVWSRFNLACELTLLGDHKGALRLLEAIDRIGGPDADKALRVHAPRDPDFVTLAKHPRFRALVVLR